MRYAQPRRRAMALSRFDIPDDYQLMLSSCEDCACAVSDTQDGQREIIPLAPADPDDGNWVSGSDVTEFPLDGEHQMLFNPVGSAGVVVVNEPARDIFRAFETPATVASVQRARPGR